MEPKKSKLTLKGIDESTGIPFIKEIHSLDEVKTSGTYIVIARNATSEENGFPKIHSKTDSCFCCEANLVVNCCYNDDESQSSNTYGQELTISDKENNTTGTYKRTVGPAGCSEWLMVATGDIKLIAQNNDIVKAYNEVSANLNAALERIDKAEDTVSKSHNTVLESATVRFDRIEENEATINAGEIGSTPSAIVYYKPANKFVATDSAGAYWDTWDGMEAYMSGGAVRRDKVYLCYGEAYIVVSNILMPISNAQILSCITDVTQLELVKGHYYSLKKAVGELAPSTFYPYEGYGCVKAVVKKGDVIRLTTVGSAADDDDARAYAFADQNNKLINIASEGMILENWILTAPEDGYLYVNCKSKSYYKFNAIVIKATKHTLNKMEASLSNLTDALDFNYEEPVLELVNGQYIYKSGALASLSDYSYSKPIFVRKGSLVKTISAGTADASAAIAVCSAPDSTSFTVLQTHTQTLNIEEHSCTIEEDCYISVCGSTQYAMKIIVSKVSAIDNLSNVLGYKCEEPVLELVNGQYIYKSGALASLSGYSYSKPIFVRKGSLVKTISAGTADASAAIAVCSAPDSTSFTVLQTHTQTLKVEEHSCTIEEDCYISVCGSTQYAMKIIIQNVNLLTDIPAQDINNNYNKWVYSFVDNCICIGDSVTQGHIYDYPRTPAGGNVIEEKSYPAYLSKMTQWSIENAALAGISVVRWWQEYFPKYDYANYQIAIMELGYNGGLTDTLDADVEPYSNYEDYAETNTGCYCKIIEAITKANPNIFFIIMIPSLWIPNNVGAKVIRKIAKKYSLSIIDLSDKNHINLDDVKYHGLTNESPDSINMVHFNALGYCAKAGFIYNKLADILIDNGLELNNKQKAI